LVLGNRNRADSPLQIAILKFFVVLLYRFPNMIVGVIRRESIGAALKCGITAQQIISYLQANAHPEMRKQDQLVPPTVADQIRLWQMERDRLQKLSGTLYEDFKSLNEFQVVKNFAENNKVLVYSNPTIGTGLLVISPEGEVMLREYLEGRKQ